VPLDVSESALREAVQAIVSDYPALRVHGVVGDFTQPLEGLPGESPRLVAFLGGSPVSVASCDTTSGCCSARTW
jgi:L-histidine N-alpha-methyltransferase